MRAIGKNIIVKRPPAENTNALGLIYTDTQRVTPAEVIAVGQDIDTVQTGDSLIINWSSTVPVKLTDETVYIVHIDNVYAVV